MTNDIEKLIEEAILKIIELYKSPDGAAGGYGHIVFDDDNIETEFIEWCIKEAEKGKYKLCEETRILSIEALKAMLQLSDEERMTANQKAFKQIYSR